MLGAPARILGPCERGLGALAECLLKLDRGFSE